MMLDLQKAGLWKRTAAWMFDGILVCILAVGLGVLLSLLLGYDGYSDTMDAAYAQYESAYGVTFDISRGEYDGLSQEQRQAYDDAYAALTADQDAMYAYNMMISLTMLITTAAIFLAVLVMEFLLPLLLGNGQTLGKKIFSLCLVRNDGVQVNPLQLFARTVLGKFTIETMVPVYLLMMLFWGTAGLWGTVALMGLMVVEILCLSLSRTNSAIHDYLAGTVVVDMGSQMIFRSTEDLISWKKKIAADNAARQSY